MLYTQAKAYLVEKLKEAGLKTKPYTTMKSLSRSLESHVGAVLPGTEMIARNGSKTIYQDQEGAQHKRRKLFDRNVTFQVVLGDYTDDKVEAMLEKFLAALDQGDVDLAGAEQALQVVARAGAGHQLQFEALFLELFPELAGEHSVAAALGAGGHGRAHRRRRGDEIEHRGDQGGDHRDQPEVGADQDGEVLEQVLDAIHERSLCCSPEGYDGCGRAHSSA